MQLFHHRRNEKSLFFIILSSFRAVFSVGDDVQEPFMLNVKWTAYAT